ncbi:DUF1492 domain-containing protein [Streptococcus oralis]|uniref:DUF1492 domain-containing protein n=1 Tax=Streptococcus oralis TaxID=1303 RepID=UPI0022842567|nr:DUF1492 domain-containing protein [Streptococcus oralis]MCY7080070.1 DUF1492 domain-containing protein [Streptococcus oralis]
MTDIEKRLKQLPFDDIKIRSLHNEIVKLNSGIVKGQSFNGMPKSSSIDNRTEDINILIIDRTRELYEEINKIYKERKKIIDWIESLEDPIENMIMRLLYIDGLSWNEVQRQLRCGRTTIKRVRRNAIKKMALMALNGTN